MRHLYICNTTGDKVDKIDIEDFISDKSIKLPGVNRSRIGPHGLCIQGEYLFTSNCYDGSVSIINMESGKANSYYLGRYCRDICALGNHLYIICGDSNSIVIFDMITKEILEIIPSGDSPHSIDCSAYNEQIVVANNGDDSITIFDSLYGCDIVNIGVGSSPTKALFSPRGDYIMVCESGMGSMDRGCIRILSSKSYKVLEKILVGNCPFDMFCDDRYCYVSNYGDGTISVIDLMNLKNINTIRIGGMPRGIISENNHIYVGDSYNYSVMKIDVDNPAKKEIILLSGQPTGMIIG